MKFEQLKLKPFLLKALKSLDFYKTTKVQSLVIPKALKNESLVVESATGSGKTHSFLIPIFQHLNVEKKEIQSVIIAPTRELAYQLFEVASRLAAFLPALDLRLYVGGTNRDDEIRRLQNSQPQLIIGTLGRITDLAIKSNVLKLYNANKVVIDEADMVFDQKEMVDVDKVMGLFINQPQFLIFSATMPKPLRHFINKYLSGIEEVIIEETNLTKEQIKHYMIPCKAMDKKEVLLQLIKVINPYLAIIFVNKIENIDPLAAFLSEHNFKVAKLHGDLDVRERRQIIRRIHNLEFQYVVASDIASRGIDIEGVSHVINFELPKDIEFYIHRCGRTARYKNEGIAISLYDYDTKQYVEQLEQKGLRPHFMKIVDNELVPTKMSKPRVRVSPINEYEAKLHATHQLPKKVKPGYKKKRLETINLKLKKAKRARIEEIYRKKRKEQ